MDPVTKYIIHLADNALILGHRNSEWTGHGPILEQDIAISNIALDLIGQARNFYQLAANRINESEQGKITTEDDLAYLRDVHEFKNLLLVEQPNGDWARTILRQFYFSMYQVLLFQHLLECTNRPTTNRQRLSREIQGSTIVELPTVNGQRSTIQEIAEKSIKETRYHVKWSSEWVLRLGDGTPESRRRILAAIVDLKPHIAEMFLPVAFEKETALNGTTVSSESLQEEWYRRVNEIMLKATLPLTIPEKKPVMILSGKNGKHTEHLGYLLAEMQFLQRTYPGSTW